MNDKKKFLSKIVFFDLETTNLKGNLGRVLAGSFLALESDKPVTISALDRRYRARGIGDDSKIVAAIREILNDAWIWVGWNSKLFDVPYLNARLRLHNLLPVEKRLHLDLMYYARGQFIRLNNSRLDTVAKAFKLKDQKTDMLYDTWVNAALGDSEALTYVVEHCEHDVLVLREAFEILQPFIRNIHY